MNKISVGLTSGGNRKNIMQQNLAAGLGDIIQLSFVPPDVQKALKFWTEIIGAGPFVKIEHVKVESTKFQGQESDIDFTIYVGYWGAMQIEIVEQHNAAPSIFKDWRDAGSDGLHHICIINSDMNKVRATLHEKGAKILQEVILPGGGEALYADTGGGPGTILEVLKPPPGTVEAFAYIQSLSRNWDGCDPVRKLG